MSSDWKHSWNQRHAKHTIEKDEKNHEESSSGQKYQHVYPKETSSSQGGTDQKNTSLLNMLRAQSLNDTEDMTPKPSKLNSKLTAFDEGMQMQGTVVPTEIKPSVTSKKQSKIVSR